MNNDYFIKNMAHINNPKYFVTYRAVRENIAYNKAIKEKHKIRELEFLLSAGQKSRWFRAKVIVTLLGTDISSEVDVPMCSYERFEDFLRNKRRLVKMINKATSELENRIPNITEGREYAECA